MALSLIYRQPTIFGFRSCLAFETSLRKSPSDLPPVASLTCIGELTFGYVLRSAGLKSCQSPMCAMRHITPLTECSCRGKLKQEKLFPLGQGQRLGNCCSLYTLEAGSLLEPV